MAEIAAAAEPVAECAHQYCADGCCMGQCRECLEYDPDWVPFDAV